MNKIKFSHNYHKFPFSISRMDKVILLEVLKSRTEELSEAFVKYDTEIENPRNTTSDYITPLKYYELPRGDILILILQATREIWDGERLIYQISGLFTTIRRWTPEKEKYYKSLRGQQVEIIINDGGKDGKKV